jgi:deazaflavin-dependent oxidoreductase (nitroreductase family)
MARVTAPIGRALAGKRFFPLYAVVHHRGRRTGRALTVPVAVRPADDGLVIVLPYGAGTNWARNVLAAGGCVVRWKGADHRMTEPELLDRARARPYYGGGDWTVIERLMKAEAFLLLRFADPAQR